MLRRILTYALISLATFGLLTILKQFDLVDIYADENEAGIKFMYGDKAREIRTGIIETQDGEIIGD